MKKLLSKQELATKLGITIIKVEQLTEIGLKRVDGTDLYSWYQVKKFMRKLEKNPSKSPLHRGVKRNPL